MKLVIAEKPSIGRAIAPVLGSVEKRDNHIRCGDYTVAWCRGHLLRGFEPHEYREDWKQWNARTLPIIPGEWKSRVTKDTQPLYNTIKSLLKEADVVIHAGDPDREGQVLVDEVLHHCGYRGPVQRILIASPDKVSVQRAFEQIADNKEPRFVGLYEAGVGRSRADWLVGMNVTRALTVSARAQGMNRVFHSGRVQTPTLALVYDREQQIRSFVAKDYFVPILTIGHAAGQFEGLWVPREMDGVDEENRILKREIAQSLLDGSLQTGVLSKVEGKNTKNFPPMPWKLSTLQVEAGKQFSLTPDQVLSGVQSLYDAGYVTYPRTDSEYLPETLLEDVPATLAHLGGAVDFARDADSSLRHKAWNTKKCPVHHAIVPTTQGLSGGLSDGNAVLIYRMISERYVRLFFPPAEYFDTVVIADIGEHQWKGTGRRLLSPGWRVTLPSQAEDRILPEMKKGDEVRGLEGRIESRVTSPPKRFTQATLIEAMVNIHRFVEDADVKARLRESSGIGTEATRANITKNLVERGYIEEKGKKKELHILQAGEQEIRATPNELRDPGITAVWEDFLKMLEQQAQGVTLEKFESAQQDTVKNMVERALNADFGGQRHPCPDCGDYLAKREPGKKAKFKKSFWACMNSQDCRAAFSDDNGVPGQRWVAAVEHDIECPACHKRGLLQGENKQGKGYFLCKKCDTFFDDNDGVPRVQERDKPTGVDCPACGEADLSRRQSKKGTDYWRCKKCQAMFGDKGGAPGDRWVFSKK